MRFSPYNTQRENNILNNTKLNNIYSNKNTYNNNNNNNNNYQNRNYNYVNKVNYQNEGCYTNYNNMYINNDKMYKIPNTNSNFDFERKIDSLLLSNAFTKLKNENKTYEELESFALKLEITNIKYSQKHENMKFEIIRLNQKIIDLNTIIQENEIETKKLLNQIAFLEKDREIMFSRIQTQELNFMNIENNTKIMQSQSNFQENNLLDNKYLIRTSNDLDNNNNHNLKNMIYSEDNNNNFTENNSGNSKRNKYNKNNNKLDSKKNTINNKNFTTEEDNNEKKDINSISEDTDSSLIEGFVNNESLLDSIKRRENDIIDKSDNKKVKKRSIKWKDILTCEDKEKIKYLNKINSYENLKNENKKYLQDIEKLNEKILSMARENRNLEKKIKEKDDIIESSYHEIESLKKDVYYLNQLNKNNSNNNKSNNNNNNNKIDTQEENYDDELSDISPTTPDVDSEYNSPALKKIKNYIKDNKSYIKNPINQNTPSTVNKNYFYKNNINYEDYLKKKNINFDDCENTKINRNLFNKNSVKNLKSNAEKLKEKNFKKKYFDRYSNHELSENNENQILSTENNNRHKSVHLSKNNFTFQENEILRQNDSSNFNSLHNINNSDFVVKNENEKKSFLKNLEDLKKDLDLFLKEYGIKEQFNKENNSLINNNIDFQIEFKFKEIRYITVNLKKINIIFKSLFVEFTKNIANSLDKVNEDVTQKLNFLENKIEITSTEITCLVLKN